MDILALNPLELPQDEAIEIAKTLSNHNRADLHGVTEMLGDYALSSIEHNEEMLQHFYKPIVKKATKLTGENEKKVAGYLQRILDACVSQVASNHGQVQNLLNSFNERMVNYVPTDLDSGDSPTGETHPESERLVSGRYVQTDLDEPRLGRLSTPTSMSPVSTVQSGLIIPPELGTTIIGTDQTAIPVPSGTGIATVQTGQSESGTATTIPVLPSSPMRFGEFPVPPHTGGGTPPIIPPDLNCPPNTRPIFDANTNTWRCQPCPPGTIFNPNTFRCEPIPPESESCYEPPPPPPPPPPPIVILPTCPVPSEQCPEGYEWVWNMYTAKWECSLGGAPHPKPDDKPTTQIPECQEIIDKVDFTVNLRCDQLPKAYQERMTQCGFNCGDNKNEPEPDKSHKLSPEWLALVIRAALLIGMVPK